MPLSLPLGPGGSPVGVQFLRPDDDERPIARWEHPCDDSSFLSRKPGGH